MIGGCCSSLHPTWVKACWFRIPSRANILPPSFLLFFLKRLLPAGTSYLAPLKPAETGMETSLLSKEYSRTLSAVSAGDHAETRFWQFVYAFRGPRQIRYACVFLLGTSTKHCLGVAGWVGGSSSHHLLLRTCIRPFFSSLSTDTRAQDSRSCSQIGGMQRQQAQYLPGWRQYTV